jgi:hypothetical protein
VASLAKEHQASLLRAAISYARTPASVNLDTLRRQIGALESSRHFLNDVGVMYLEPARRARYGALQVEHFFGSANRVAGSVTAVLQVVAINEELDFTLSYTALYSRTRWLTRSLLSSFGWRDI